MRFLFLIALILPLLARISMAAPPYPPTATLEEVRAAVEKAISKGHPRLFTDGQGLAALKATADADPIQRQLADAIIQQADWLMDIKPVQRKLTGRRLLGVSRACLKRTLLLATAYHLTGRQEYADRCAREMQAAARFPDWNPSHFLDVAEMTLALAIGYDWLYDQLEDPVRDEIRTAIVKKGLTTKNKGWVRASNNWGQVCHGGLTAGALSVMEDEPDLTARTVHLALHNVTRSMAAFAPRGSYPEGPGYWSYGTGYNVVLIAVMESVLGTDFGLQQAPGFAETGQYLSLATGPSGLHFNYADGGAGRSFQPSLCWFAQRYQRPDWRRGESDRLLKTISSLRPRDAGTDRNRFLPLGLLWYLPPADTAPQMPLHWFGGGEVPISIHRQSWDDAVATYIGFKAGSPSANHGQMDIGSFVLDCGGVRWAHDLGSEGYHGVESRGMNLWGRAQQGDRWKIFRLNNFSHNTLVIDGQLQQAAGRGEITRFSDDPQKAYSILDMSPVYAGQAGSVQRGIRMIDSGRVLVQDEIRGLKPGAVVRWGMLTRATAPHWGGTRLELEEGEAHLTLMLLAPAGSVWKEVDTATPRNEWDSANRGTRMATFEAVAPESGRLDLAVLAVPGSHGQDGPPLKTVALEQW